MKAPEPTLEEINETLERIDARGGSNDEAEAERNRKRKVEIYDDFCHVPTDIRTLHIPQPTLGFLMLYGERRSYFEDDEHGLGRLMAALTRQKEPGYIPALRMGGDVPNDEADEAMKGVYGEDRAEYYLAIEAAAQRSADETEKKTMKLLELRMGLDSGLMERLLKSSSLPDTPLTTSSTECPSAPLET